MPADGRAARCPRPSSARFRPRPTTRRCPRYWNGNYAGALAAFQSEFNAAIKSPGSQSASGRWIDSICYLTMAGECYYHMGQLPEALTQYNNAPDPLRVVPRLDAPRSISALHFSGRPADRGRWCPGEYRSGNSGVGQFPQTFLISQGNINNLQAVVQGGVVQQPMMVPISAAEIVRCTTLAIRRRHELMGPVCKYDALTNQLITLLQRVPLRRTIGRRPGSISPLGTAQAAAGDLTSRRSNAGAGRGRAWRVGPSADGRRPV